MADDGKNEHGFYPIIPGPVWTLYRDGRWEVELPDSPQGTPSNVDSEPDSPQGTPSNVDSEPDSPQGTPSNVDSEPGVLVVQRLHEDPLW